MGIVGEDDEGGRTMRMRKINTTANVLKWAVRMKIVNSTASVF
jgi:hypothetical protein